MISKIKLPPSQAIIYLTVIYIIGVVGILTEATRPLFIMLVPVNILLAVFVAAIYHPAYTPRFLISCGMVYLGGFAIEWLGVKTGYIFGSYTYGTGLGFLIDGVPPMMGFNWLLLVYGSIAIAGRFLKKKYQIALAAAILMVLYDIFLEPSAIRYHFWAWQDESVPLQNYVAWLICAFVFIRFFMAAITVEIKNTVAEAIFWLQLAFFGLIWMANNLMA